MRMKFLVMVMALLLPATAVGQSVWIGTSRPDDVTVARLLGYVSGVELRCRNLEIDSQERARFLSLGNISNSEIEKGGRLHQHFEDHKALALRQQFDSECAMVLRGNRGLLRLRPGEPEPKGTGFIRETIQPNVSARSTWNRTTWPDDVAAARILGYLSSVQSRCKNLEINSQEMAKILALSDVTESDTDKGGRLHQHFEDQQRLAFRQEFDSECAMVLRTNRFLLRLRPGEPEPKGEGFIRQIIKPCDKMPPTPCLD